MTLNSVCSLLLEKKWWKKIGKYFMPEKTQFFSLCPLTDHSPKQGTPHREKDWNDPIPSTLPSHYLNGWKTKNRKSSHLYWGYIKYLGGKRAKFVSLRKRGGQSQVSILCCHPVGAAERLPTSAPLNTWTHLPAKPFPSYPTLWFRTWHLSRQLHYISDQNLISKCWVYNKQLVCLWNKTH